MKLIDADKLIEALYKTTPRNKAMSKPYLGTIGALEAVIAQVPTISLDEGVRLIWAAQIDDIIEKIKEFKHDCEDIPYEDCPSENGKGTCRTCTVDRIIKILEEAKA